MSVKIVIDSTVDVSPSLKGEFTIVPLIINFESEEYVDGVTITRKQFYEKLIESDIMPTTSQATPAMFDECFENVTSKENTAVVVTLSATLSGTYQSAVIAAEEYSDKVFVVDSKSASIGAGILAEYALKLSKEGLSAQDIVKKLTIKREDIRVIAMLDTLEYLKKGGRISKTVAFAGGILSIKPVISVVDGEIKVLGKARGSKQGNNLLISEIEAAGGVDFNMPVLLGYSGLSDILLNKYIEDSKRLWENVNVKLNITDISSVIGTHAGPGAIAAAFFKK